MLPIMLVMIQLVVEAATRITRSLIELSVIALSPLLVRLTPVELVLMTAVPLLVLAVQAMIFWLPATGAASV